MPTKELIKTKHIKDALSRYATDNLLPISECDFTINKVETLVQNNRSHEFEHYTKERLLEYLDRDKIINEHVEFAQIYTITAMQKEKQEVELLYSIDYGRYATHPKLILSPKSKIPYKLYKPVELLRLLYIEINKIKASNKILIQLFDEKMKKTLKNFVKYLYASKFTKKVKIPLFEGIEPIISRESKVIFWFKEKEHDSMIIEVDKDEILIEYKKPLYGRNGLNAYGKNIDTVYAQNSDIHVEIDPKSVRIEEDNNSKRYISINRGYVHYDGVKLSVDNRLRLHEISRNKHIIDTEDEGNNIDIIVAQHDTTKDSIGEGVELVSESIHVEGFVGANSRLEAMQLEIKGATHQDSKQYAKFAKINRHKGTLRCHKAEIGLLEGGIIHATKVNIESSLGGQVYAQDVTIGHTKNNLKVYASNSITVRLASGEDNLFKISYQDIPVLKAKIEYIKQELDDLKYKLEQAKRFKYDNLKLLEDEIASLKAEEKSIKNSYKNATISVEQPFRGLNHIVFTIDKEHELHYKTDAKAYLPFHLKIEENKITLLPPAISLTIE
ncbi:MULTISPECIES: flagellar assembly protein A [Sulfurimonas]|uniref:flagellar assembly protein A n=1 Tax=Sulfurimonas TaxID=202746 RepID=UPI0012652BD8|nr:flagellar assembly protein A [Sulfurimonas indica]